MNHPPQHTVILPYFCNEEVTRYLKIADRLEDFPKPAGGYRFLLASSPRMKTNEQLLERYDQIGDAIPFACPSQVFGYPEGPTAMFWDCMDFLAANFSEEDGFGVWLESDMAPIKPDWIDRLSAEWYQGTEQGNPPPIMMGCYVPEVYKYRFFKKPKLMLDPHVNGGACYATNFAKHMPKAARNGVFDMAVFQYAKKLGRVRFSSQISFSTTARMRRDLLDDRKVLLHGFMQDKDKFIEGCLRPLTEQEKSAARWEPVRESWEQLQRQIRVRVIRKGHRAMLENMFLAKSKFEASSNAGR